MALMGLLRPFQEPFRTAGLAGPGSTPGQPTRLALFCAVPRRDLPFGSIFPGSVRDHRSEYRIVRLIPIGNGLPGFAVPLRHASGASALVIATGHLQRSQHAFEAKLL